MYQIIIKGFKNKEDAETFLGWFEGSGEQGVGDWFDARRYQNELKTDTYDVLTDIEKTYPLKWEENSLILVVRSYSVNE